MCSGKCSSESNGDDENDMDTTMCSDRWELFLFFFNCMENFACHLCSFVQ